VVTKRKAPRASLLDDESFGFVVDDGDTGSSGDVCARKRCGLERSKHSEIGECPDGGGRFKEGA
jgi:hypothetical protein